MRISFSPACKQVAQPLVNFPAGGINDPFILPQRNKDKVVVVIGATGTGKSRLAIDLATHLPAEIINSDKMQVYKGLDIATNKVTDAECRSVPHHLLGIVDPNADFNATDFRHLALHACDSIVRRNGLPIIAGGSNSYIKALVSDDFEFRSKYDCCFLWVDVKLPVLHSFVSERVDRMVEAGLVDEVRAMFDPNADYKVGIRRAIGVPEMDQFLRSESDPNVDSQTRARLLKQAIEEIKSNTCDLACRQLKNILSLRTQLGLGLGLGLDLGLGLGLGLEWNMLHRLDATEVFLRRGSAAADEAWERMVAKPSTIIVDRFLHEKEDQQDFMAAIAAPASISAAAVAATTR